MARYFGAERLVEEGAREEQQEIEEQREEQRERDEEREEESSDEEVVEDVGPSRPTVLQPLRQNINDNINDLPASLRHIPEEVRLRHTLFRQLDGMGFRTTTHPSLAPLVMREIRRVMQGPTNGAGAIDEEGMLNRVLDEYLSNPNNSEVVSNNEPQVPPHNNSAPNLAASSMNGNGRPVVPRVPTFFQYPPAFGSLSRAGTWHGHTNNNNNANGNGNNNNGAASGMGRMPGGLL